MIVSLAVRVLTNVRWVLSLRARSIRLIRMCAPSVAHVQMFAPVVLSPCKHPRGVLQPRELPLAVPFFVQKCGIIDEKRV